MEQPLDQQTEIIERLTRVEVTLQQLVEGFAKFERKLTGESGTNGMIGRLDGRVTVLERVVVGLTAVGAFVWAIVKFAATLIGEHR